MDIPREEIKKANQLVSSVPKFVHYRDIHPEINKDNYQTCTRVDYHPIENTCKNIIEMWGRLKAIHKDKITSEHESHPKSGSKYFTTEDGYVYRMSNHWGIVKTCIWTRAGEGNFIASLHLSGPVEIGRVHLSEFEVYRMKDDRKKDLIINPKWIERVMTLVDLANHLLEIKHSPEFKNLSIEDKKLVGYHAGMFSKHLFLIKDLELSKNIHTFVI